MNKYLAATVFLTLLAAGLAGPRPAVALDAPTPLEDRSVTGALAPPTPLQDHSVTGVPAPPVPLGDHSITGVSPAPAVGFGEALKEYRSENYRAAAASAAQSAKLALGTPWEGRLEFLSARAYAASDNLDSASALFASARQKLPLLGDYTFYLLAGAYARAGLHGEALSAYESLLREYPASPLSMEATLNSAEELIALRRYTAALERLTPVIERGAGRLTARARYLLMLAYEGLDEYRQAVSQYRTLWLDYPHTPETTQAGGLLKRLKEAGQAIPEFSAEDHIKRAGMLSRRGLYADAIEDYKYALKTLPEKDPLRGEVWYRLGVAYYKMREDSQCEAALSSALSIGTPATDTPDALYWLARVYLRGGDTIRFRDAALTAGFGYPGSPRSVDALYLLGVTLSQDGEYDAALEIFNLLLSMHPDSRRADEALWQMGWANFRKGDFPSAEKGFAALVSGFPGSELVPQALHWRARALSKMGDLAGAQALQAGVLARNPLSFYGLIPQGDEMITMGNGPVRKSDPPYPRLKDSYRDQQLIRAYELGLQGMRQGALRELKKAEGGYCQSIEGIRAIAGVYGYLGDYSRPLELAAQLYRTPLACGSGEIPGDALSLMFPLGYWSTVSKEAGESGLDPFLVAALIREESRYDKDAVSPAGAVGLMQLMPGTARAMCRKADVTYRSPDSLKDERVNVPLGVCYLKSLIDKHGGRLVYVLTEYNAGPTALAKWKAKMPDAPDDYFVEGIEYQETRGYVKRVLRNYYIYRMLYGE